MKFIEQPILQQLAQALSYETDECSVHTRMEVYSCKPIKRDKKLSKTLESSRRDEAAHSPPLPSWVTVEEVDQTPFGPFDKHSSRKTLYSLIGTLNLSYPDYDFSDVRPAHFVKEQSGAEILNALSNPHRAGSIAPRSYSSYPSASSDLFPKAKPTSSSPHSRTIQSPLAPPPIISGTHPYIYRTLDEVIGLSECEVFSYTPDIDSDPHACGEDDDSDSLSSESDDDYDQLQFEFDDYEIERRNKMPVRGMSDSSDDSDDAFPPSRRRHGAVLWSNHWFFMNRKQKRILYITIWAHPKRPVWFPVGEMASTSNERFVGWEGATGAGARAMGIFV